MLCRCRVLVSARSIIPPALWAAGGLEITFYRLLSSPLPYYRSTLYPSPLLLPQGRVYPSPTPPRSSNLTGPIGVNVSKMRHPKIRILVSVLLASGDDSFIQPLCMRGLTQSPPKPSKTALVSAIWAAFCAPKAAEGDPHRML